MAVTNKNKNGFYPNLRWIPADAQSQMLGYEVLDGFPNVSLENPVTFVDDENKVYTFTDLSNANYFYNNEIVGKNKVLKRRFTPIHEVTVTAPRPTLLLKLNRYMKELGFKEIKDQTIQLNDATSQILPNTNPDHKPTPEPTDVVDYYTELNTKPKPDPTITKIMLGEYNGRRFAPTTENVEHYLDVYEKDKKVNEGWGDKLWGKIGGYVGAGALAASGASYALPWVLSNPYIMNGLNLWGAYEGGKDFFSSDGVAKTWKLFSNGDFLGGTKSLTGDVLDLFMMYPAARGLKSGFEYALTQTMPGKRLIETAMRTTDAQNPIPQIIYGMKYLPWRPRINYILFGNNPKLRKFFHLPMMHYKDNSWSLGWEPYTGVYEHKLHTKKGYGDVIDAYLYGTPLDPKIATLDTSDEGLSFFNSYINKNYLGRPILTYTVNGNVDPNDVVTMGNWEGAIDPIAGTFKTLKMGTINVAGHNIQLGKLADGTRVVRGFDIWKFNPSDYSKKWGITSALGKYGLLIVDKAGNPIIFKQPWTKRTDAIQSMFIDSSIFDEILEKFMKKKLSIKI